MEMPGCTKGGTISMNSDKGTYISICKPSFNATNRRNLQQLTQG
jgi:hypothetical protein